MPVNAVMFVAVIAGLITLPALIEVNFGTEEAPIILPTAFYAVVSVAVIGLYLAFAIPIYLRWKIGDAFEAGSWTNGSKYKWMNPIAVAEIVIISHLLHPPARTRRAGSATRTSTWKFVNYAPILTFGTLAGRGDLVAGVGEELVHRSEAHDRRGGRQGVRGLTSSSMPSSTRCPSWQVRDQSRTCQAG